MPHEDYVATLDNYEATLKSIAEKDSYYSDILSKIDVDISDDFSYKEKLKLWTKQRTQLKNALNDMVKEFLSREKLLYLTELDISKYSCSGTTKAEVISRLDNIKDIKFETNDSRIWSFFKVTVPDLPEVVIDFSITTYNDFAIIGQNWPQLLCISCSPGFALGFVGLHMVITFIDMIYESIVVKFHINEFAHPYHWLHLFWLIVDITSLIGLIIGSVGVCKGNATKMLIGIIIAIFGAVRRVICILVTLYDVFTYVRPNHASNLSDQLTYQFAFVYIFGFTLMLLSHILEAMTLYKLRKFTKQGDDDEESG